MDVLETTELARDSAGKSAMQGALGIMFEHVDICGGGGCFSKIDGLVGTIGRPDKCEAASSDTAMVHVDDTDAYCRPDGLSFGQLDVTKVGK